MKLKCLHLLSLAIFLIFAIPSFAVAQPLEAKGPNDAEVIRIVTIIALSGAAGGFVLGIQYQRSNKIRLVNRLIEIGILGDILTGMASGLAIMLVAGSLLGFEFEEPNTTQTLRLIALGIISGFAGIKMLNDLTSQVTETLSRVEEKIDENQLYNEAIRDGLFYRTNEMFDESIQSYEQALRHLPDSEEAGIGLALVTSFAAEKKNPEDRKLMLEDAIRILDGVIEKHNKSAKAYYNRACIEVLLNGVETKDKWLSDLKSAIKIRPNYRLYAKKDTDFSAFKSDSDFLAAVK